MRSSCSKLWGEDEEYRRNQVFFFNCLLPTFLVDRLSSLSFQCTISKCKGGSTVCVGLRLMSCLVEHCTWCSLRRTTRDVPLYQLLHTKSFSSIELHQLTFTSVYIEIQPRKKKNTEAWQPAICIITSVSTAGARHVALVCNLRETLNHSPWIVPQIVHVDITDTWNIPQCSELWLTPTAA
jgi:hypothetical protein